MYAGVPTTIPVIVAGVPSAVASSSGGAGVPSGDTAIAASFFDGRCKLDTAGPVPMRAPRAEQAVVEGADPREAGAIAAAEVEDDYRRALTAELVRRALEWAAG